MASGTTRRRKDGRGTREVGRCPARTSEKLPEYSAFPAHPQEDSLGLGTGWGPCRFGARQPAYIGCLPLGEKALIARIRRRVRRGTGVAVGIGDDCAVLRVPPGHELLVTTDFSLEKVHFRREWHPPEVVGWRCLTRGLSDLAAMGGEPRAAFLSLALPRDISQKWVDGFVNGLLALASKFGVTLAGGDVAQSRSGVLADIVVVGSVPRGRAILRSGARPGDGIYVTGQLGGGAAALMALRRGRKTGAEFERYFHPQPRLAVGRRLRTRGVASAMIDLSDGLSTDLAHICDESGVGAVIDAPAIPLAEVGRNGIRADLRFGLHGGDDYELLFTASGRIPEKVERVRITRIGEIVKGRGVTLVDVRGRKSKLATGGWQHFRG